MESIIVFLSVNGNAGSVTFPMLSRAGVTPLGQDGIDQRDLASVAELYDVPRFRILTAARAAFSPPVSPVIRVNSHPFTNLS